MATAHMTTRHSLNSWKSDVNDIFLYKEILLGHVQYGQIYFSTI